MIVLAVVGIMAKTFCFPIAETVQIVAIGHLTGAAAARLDDRTT
ncbi:MAG: hypothetical protein WBA29_15625 [Xanthobacteraceae bacterium]